LQLHAQSPRNASFGARNGNRWISPQRSTADAGREAIHEETAPATRALVVDRNSMSSDLLANLLGNDPSLDARAIQSCDLMQTLATAGADLVVIAADLGDKSRNGFDLAGAVGREFRSVYIVMLLDHSSRDAVVNAFRSGARGVFSRERPLVEFLECVEQVRKGSIWVGKNETESLLDALRSIPAVSLNDSHIPALTDRELQVVQCAAKGKTNKAIAWELGLSEHTVKNYLFRAFDKLGVSSRVELLFYLTQQGQKIGPAKAYATDAEIGVE
jgi:two-component system, NarL family, nitrate/nitrite response regulator NarL